MQSIPLTSRQLRIAILSLAAIIILYITYNAYMNFVFKRGTVLPLFVWWYTRHGLDQEIPPVSTSDDWKPNSRVVFTLTTMPKDIYNLQEVLWSLGNQSIRPDAIYLNVPMVNIRTNEPYTIPPYLNDMPHITINRCEDYGPLTKLFPTLLKETDPDTIIITVDDDRIYPPSLLRHLAWHAEYDSTVAWGLTGWAFMPMPLPRGVAAVYTPWYMRTAHGREVDVLQAVKGNAYRRSFFKDLDALSKPAQECFLTDDIWIAGYLATKGNVRRILTPGAWTSAWWLEAPSADWYRNKHVVKRLSEHTAEDKDINCIRAVEARFGPWRNSALND